MSFTRFTATPKNAPFKPGDDVQFRAETSRGRHGYLLGQVWSFAPAAATYWIATDAGAYVLLHRSELRLVRERGTQSADFVIEVA